MRELKEAIDRAGFDPIEYSGRGMMGRRCVAYVCDSNEVLGSLVRVALCLADEGYDDIAIEIADNAKVDDFGRGKVVYFPNYEYVRDDEVDADE